MGPLSPTDAARGEDAGTTTSPRVDWAGRLLRDALPLLGYVAVAVVAFWPTGLFDSSRLTFTGDDVAGDVWDLAWLPHALVHLHDPFVANAINYPYGANMATNTLEPLLGLLAWPFSATVGVIAAYNLFMRLAFVASALAMYAVLGRWVPSRSARFAGGLLYGFSPYMIGQGHDHLTFVFVPLPPLILGVLDELLVGDAWSPRRCGVVLGLLAGAQLLVSAEVFASTAVLALLGVVYLSLRHRERVRARLRRVLVGLGVALVPLVVLGAWQTSVLLFGPERVRGSPQAYEIAQFREDLFSPILPTINQAFGPASVVARGTSFVSGDYVENGLYLGIPLVLLVIGLGILARRRPIVGVSGVLAGVAFVLSLGSPLNVDGHVTSVTLPFALFPHLPLLQDEAASRYSLFVQLFVAVIVAAGVDEVLVRRAAAVGSFWSRPAGAIVLAAGLVVALVPIVPALPYSTYPTQPNALPPYFTDGSSDAIPTGSVVLTYPLPVWPYTEPMLWQAVDGMRFTIVSGPWNEPQDLKGVGEGTPPLLDPPQMQVLFTESLYGQPASVIYGAAAANIAAPANDAATAAALRRFLRTYDIGTIVIDPIGADPSEAIEELTAALGRQPLGIGGVEVFYDVQASVT